MMLLRTSTCVLLAGAVKTGRNMPTVVSHGLIGLAGAYLRMRVRSLSMLLLNPLALVLLASLACAYVWGLVVEGSNLRTQSMPGSWTEIAAFTYGILLIVVSLTAQRGSPLRLHLADVSWALQSPEGPRVSALLHGAMSAVLALIGSSSASAIALAMRGENPIYGVVSGVSIASLMLLLRGVSLSSHLIGLVAPRLVRTLLPFVLIAAAVLFWAASLGSRLLGIGAVTADGRGPLAAFRDPIDGILTPERGLSPYCVVIVVISILALGMVTANAQRLVEPAVHESIIAQQLSQALAGNNAMRAMQSRGFKTGIASWKRWPNSPVGALLVSHLAQTRRRFWPCVRSAFAFLLLVALSAILRDIIPMPTGILLVLLLLTVTSPSQPTATDLEHQHLLLSDVSLSRAGFLGIGLNGALEFLIALPAVLHTAFGRSFRPRRARRRLRCNSSISHVFRHHCCDWLYLRRHRPRCLLRVESQGLGSLNRI